MCCDYTFAKYVLAIFTLLLKVKYRIITYEEQHLFFLIMSERNYNILKQFDINFVYLLRFF